MNVTLHVFINMCVCVSVLFDFMCIASANEFASLNMWVCFCGADFVILHIVSSDLMSKPTGIQGPICQAYTCVVPNLLFKYCE